FDCDWSSDVCSSDLEGEGTREKMLRKLVISNFSTHRIRAALTISAIALAVSLVVAVTSGYKSAEGAAFRFLNLYMGATDAQISRSEERRVGKQRRPR